MQIEPLTKGAPDPKLFEVVYRSVGGAIVYHDQVVFRICGLEKAFEHSFGQFKAVISNHHDGSCHDFTYNKEQMALIILGKTICRLCNAVIKEGDEMKAFPAFVPYDHKFGKFSDAAFHKSCYEKDTDRDEVDNMLWVWEQLLKSIPRGLTTLEEINAATQEAFKDWPPKNGVVIYSSIDDPEDWWYADKDMWEEFEKAEAEEHERIRALREYDDDLERQAWQYLRDDD